MSRPGRWRTSIVPLILAACVCGSGGNVPAAFAGDDLKSEEVRAAIARGVAFLRSQQAADGTFLSSFAPTVRVQSRVTRTTNGRVVVSGVRVMQRGPIGFGPTALATLALLNAGLSVQDPCVARALDYLRGVHDPAILGATYDRSLLLMALVAAREWDKDRSRIAALAKALEAVQTTRGAQRGMWSYGHVAMGGDNSNTQFALLGLHDAAVAGVHIKHKTWEMALEHFVRDQNSDGGWSYVTQWARSTGSMTCSGIGSLVICQQMLSFDDAPNADGTPKCCDRKAPADRTLRRGVSWLEQHFQVDQNPGMQNQRLLYYLYGVERAGRLSAQRFFGKHDWYREGVRYLLDAQSPRDGSWMHRSGAESDKVIASSFALLFLSKGLAPVLINKLHYASAAERSKLDEDTRPNWNLHPNDIRNLTEHISTLPRWPKLLTFQEVEMEKALTAGGVGDLLQAPILYLSGTDDPNFTNAEVQLLRSYVEQGGFILAVNNCNGSGFDRGIRSLASRLFPSANAALKRLPPEHAIFRAEYKLDPAMTELWGGEFGCRTSFVYSPQDHSCLWDKWSVTGASSRRAAFQTSLRHAMRVGVNVVAFATGRAVYDKLDLPEQEATNQTESDRETPGKADKIERGLLQVAKLRHTGDWDAAPRALHNVLVALNQTSGVLASTRQHNLVPGDGNLPAYPLAYLHGRSAFQLSREEIDNLRKYLNGGAVLFKDACCGSPLFDQSVRNLVRELFPKQNLERIPITHELFSQGIGFDIRKVKERFPESGKLTDSLDLEFRDGEPFLEGIQIKGRYCVIYSKYDLSCAIERQGSVGCAGYDYHDAVRIFVNVIRYALLQDIAYADKIQ
jgi:hypothetical protein